MNFFIDNWYLILLALGSAALLLMPAMKNVGGGTLSPANAVALINREKAVVIDVSEPDEFAAGHVTGAKNIPLAQLEERLPTTAKNKALPVILVCASGKRAQSAVATATKLGYVNVQALAGGMRAWRAADMPVEKAAKA
ncbi:MAG: rhodanese-like domain-containing protein [Comamonas sp.]